MVDCADDMDGGTPKDFVSNAKRVNIMARLAMNESIEKQNVVRDFKNDYSKFFRKSVVIDSKGSEAVSQDLSLQSPKKLVLCDD